MAVENVECDHNTPSGLLPFGNVHFLLESAISNEDSPALPYRSVLVVDVHLLNWIPYNLVDNLITEGPR